MVARSKVFAFGFPITRSPDLQGVPVQFHAAVGEIRPQGLQAVGHELAFNDAVFVVSLARYRDVNADLVISGMYRDGERDASLNGVSGFEQAGVFAHRTFNFALVVKIAIHPDGKLRHLERILSYDLQVGRWNDDFGPGTGRKQDYQHREQRQPRYRKEHLAPPSRWSANPSGGRPGWSSRCAACLW